jgi:hypothetical protein
VNFGDVVLEKRVGHAEADSLAAARDDANFAGEVGTLIETELAGPQLAEGAAKVLSERVLGGHC